MKKRLKFFALTFTMCLALILFGQKEYANAQENEKVTEDGFVYSPSYDGKSLYIHGYNGIGGNIVIPGKIDGKTVKSISSLGFKDNATITSVTMGNGIEELGNETFANCSKLEQISIPASMKSVSNSFVSCENLQKFVVDKKNKMFYTDNGILMEKYNKSVTLVAYPGGRKGAFTIPKKVNYIGEQAFFGATYITSVTIPSTCKSISPNAFDSCKNLTTVTIKKGGVTSIGWKSFAHCTSLTKVSIPTDMEVISQGTFMGCTQLKTLSIAKGSKYLEVNEGVLYGKSFGNGRRLMMLLCSVVLDNGVFTVPKDVYSVGNCAFGEIEGLTTIDFSKSQLTMFEPYQFEGYMGSTVIIKKGSKLASSIENQNYIYAEDGTVNVKYVK